MVNRDFTADFVIRHPEIEVQKQDFKKLSLLAHLSFAFVILTTAMFILGCIFFLVEAIMAAPHTHSSDQAEVTAYINNIKNFWAVILGGALIGVGFIAMFAKFIVQLYEVPLLRKFANTSEIRAIFSRYQNWKNGVIALWLSFNILMGMITDSNLVHFCRAQKARFHVK